MKTIMKILLLSGLIAITTYSCRKEKTVITPQYNSNITLYNKPLNVIRANIMWKWKLEYEKGGICGTCIYRNFQNFIWEFTSDNKLIQTYNDTLFMDSDIDWSLIKYSDVSIYVANVHDLDGVPWDYKVKGIYNDTLILSDYTSDPISYYFTRLN